MFNDQFTLGISKVLARIIESEAQGQPGTPGEPGKAGASINGSRIQADGGSASITVIGDIQADRLAISVDGNEPVKLILEHPPLSFIDAEIDLDITPAGQLQLTQPAASDQVWIELGGVSFDQVAFTPQSVPPNDPNGPAVGTLVLSQGSTPVYTLNNVHAAHYGGLAGGRFSAGLDARTGYDYVAYGPAQST